MAQNSKIEWTHHTLNLWHGCTKVHEGCDNCYAEALAKRWGNDIWGNDKPRKEISSAFRELVKMQQAAKQVGEMHRVFVGSMMDIFEKPMPLVDSKGASVKWDETIDTSYVRWKLFMEIDEGKYNNLQFHPHWLLRQCSLSIAAGNLVISYFLHSSKQPTPEESLPPNSSV